MTVIAQQSPIAGGTTCDIYAYSKQHVLKLFKPHYQHGYMLHEACMVKHAQQAGLTDLVVVDDLTIEGRQALIYERINGQSLEFWLRRAPWRIHYFARCFSHVHAQLHGLPAPKKFPNQREDMVRLVEQSSLISSDIRKQLMGQMERFSSKNEVCHNDFTLRNLLLDKQGNSTIIDWNCATRGDASLDVASCWLKLMHDAWANSATRYWERHYIHYFARCYLESYLQLRPQVKPEFRHSLPFAALQLMGNAAAPQRRWLANFLDLKNPIYNETLARKI